MASHCFLLNESSMSGESDGEIGIDQKDQRWVNSLAWGINHSAASNLEESIVRLASFDE